jgi:hypothetical protein
MRICKLDKTEQIWGRGGPMPINGILLAADFNAAGFKPTDVAVQSQPTIGTPDTSINNSDNSSTDTVAIGPMGVACAVGGIAAGLGHASQNKGNVGLADTATAVGFGCLSGVASTLGGLAGAGLAIGAAVAGSVGSQAALGASTSGLGPDGTQSTQGSTAGNGDAVGLGGYGTDTSGFGTY